MAQPVMVVQILVAERNPKHTLAHHVDQAMTNLAALTAVAQAAGDTSRQIEHPTRLMQQQHATV